MPVQRRTALHAATGLALLLACAPAPAAEPERPAQARVPPPAATARTAKERMGDKSADEQRVDDCKVPPERRTRPRPVACPGEAGR